MGDVKEQDASSGLVDRIWVRRNDEGELVVESWADGIRSETPVTRDANVDVKGRKPFR